jgi:salicylate hydroxylase
LGCVESSSSSIQSIELYLHCLSDWKTRSKADNEVKAGLQLTPNATRLFKIWGVYDELLKKATVPTQLSVHRYDGTKLLAHEPQFQEQIMERYGSPFWDMHRVDLQQALARRAEELGVTIRLGCKVKTLDLDGPSPAVTLESGETIAGDVVLCADGLWSTTRSQFLGAPTPAKLTGDLAYRIVINTSDLHGPDAAQLRKFITDSAVNFWAGPNSHVVSYTLRAGEMFNIVLLCPDNLPPEVTKTAGDLEEMKKLFERWDPLLRKFLEQVKEVAKWKLMWLEPLPEWGSRDGRFVMAGDACHPMLPYLAQGANSSLEDGAVIGHLLSYVKRETKEDQLPRFKAVYEKLRKGRGETIQAETFRQRHDFHLEDGPEQEDRDRLMVGQLGKELVPDFPSRWTCPRVQRWLYGYDAYGEAEEAYQADPF